MKTVTGKNKDHNCKTHVDGMSEFFKVMSDKTRLRILIELLDKSLCVNCGACAAICSAGIFRKDENGNVEAREKPCMECFHCTSCWGATFP